MVATLVSTAALFVWAVGVFVLFNKVQPRRAVLIAYISGVLFLPEMRQPANWDGAARVVALPFFKVTKPNVIGLTLLLATLAFDLDRWKKFRPRWFDVPMFVWCCATIPATVLLQPPPEEGIAQWQDVFAQFREQVLLWGVPYLIGRIYFTDLEAFRELIIACVLGCVVYIPFCLAEIPLGPKRGWHFLIYQFMQHDPQQAERGSLFRPVCFMEHGLATALWMHCGALLAFALWSTGSWTSLPLGKNQPPVKVGFLFLALAALAVLSGSKGALVLVVIGGGVFILTRWGKFRLAVAVLVLLGPLYITGRLLTAREPTGWLLVNFHSDEGEEAEERAANKPFLGYTRTSTRQVLGDIGKIFGSDRTQSFEYRVQNEDKLMEKALVRPWFGWGGWDRASIRDNPEDVPDNDEARKRTVPDGMWILTLGDRGFVGLISLYLAMLLPTVRFLWCHPPWVWSKPMVVPVAAAAIVLVLVMIDMVSNAQINPLYTLMAGGVTTLTGRGGPIPTKPEPPPTEAAAPGQLQVQQPRGLLRRPLPFVR